MKVIITFKEILESGNWSKFCQDYGINEWCINEGLANSKTTKEISIEDAKRYGLLDNLKGK